uniref:hypothetical protein n=1 Tax=Gracilaria pacifica TaxID=31471 RepID=UPI001D12E0E0|nr:hypothetical protein LK037_pgp149 [Gracilaria pacifica]UAD86956.1 hypothetical protein [Gracilaria pacifica]
MFEVYLILVTCFLLPICYLITNSLISIYHQVKTLMNIKKSTIYINNKNVLYLAKIYIHRKQWLDCITMIEFYMTQIVINETTTIVQYYNYIALCYQSINMYTIAKKYYLKAYQQEPLNKHILKNLANIYKLSGDIENANKTDQKLIELNEYQDI